MKGKINVLYITDMFLGKGGAEKNLLQLVRGLDRSRYVPSVLCLHHGGLIRELKRDGIEGRDLALQRVYGPRGILEAVRLFRYIRERNISVVVTYHESSDLLGGLVARLAGVPVVISNRRDMGYKLKQRHILMYRLINHFFDRIIVVSEAVREAVFERQRVLWNKLVTVYNGVDPDVARISGDEKDSLRASLGLSDRDWLVVGTAGSVRSVKGYRFLIAAAAMVVREFPKVYFLIMGSFDDTEYLEGLRGLARELGIEKNIVFGGYTANALPFIQLMDVCVSASLSEGMSNAVLEYMACGRAVVATRAGGNPEVVENGVTGLLVPAQDAVSLAEALTTLLKDPAKRESMGRAGRKAIERKFSVSAMLKKISGLYERLLEEKGPRRTFPPYDQEAVNRTISRGVKGLTSGFSHYSGISFLLRGLSGKGIRILAYHRVADTWFDPLSMCLPVGLFERNLMHIRRAYVPFPLDEALYLLRQGKMIPDRALALTFDDGYADNLTNAVPLLERYKIPAAVFLSVNAIERKEPLWYDRIVEAVRKCRLPAADLRPMGLRRYDLRTFPRKLSACREIVGACRRVPNCARGGLVQAVTAALGADAARSPMLDWQQVKQLAARGFCIGSHGMNHYALQGLMPSEVDIEVRESKRLIRERTGVDVMFFANPYGSPLDYNDDAAVIMRHNGYSAGFSLARGVNTDSSAFTLGRYCVSPGMVLGFTGEYSTRVFDLQLSLPYALPRAPVINVVQPA